jgi:hypothetical protein
MAEPEQTLRDWHRLFGLILTDFFTDSPFIVEVERDLSMQQQLLDVVVVRREKGNFTSQLPDGLEKLTNHNLITFKSHHEALDAWAMKELVGHYVAYRKLASARPTDLLPEEQFRLFAVCARFPQNLSTQIQWQKQKPGVYDCLWGTDTIRVIVAGDLPEEPQNAPIHLFSARAKLIGYGQSSYIRHSTQSSKLMGLLFDQLEGEGFTMAYTWKDFERDYFLRFFPKLTPHEQEEVLRTVSVQVREKLVNALPVEQRLEGLSTEARLDGLSEEQIRQYLEKISTKHNTPPPKKRRKK